MKPYRSIQKSNAHLILPVLLLCALFIFFQIKWVNNNPDKFVDPDTVNYIQQFNPTIDLRILCPACSGTGEFIDELNGQPNVVPCPLSFGMGFHELKIDPAKQAICHTCGGMGATLDGSSPATPVACSVCQSAGVLEAEDPYSRMQGPIRTFIFECHHCNAQGNVYDSAADKPIPCPICLGRGERQTRAMEGIENSCGNCGGMGRWINPESDQADTCPRCTGHGLVNSTTEPDNE